MHKWMQVQHSSSKPGVTAGYFIESVVNEAGCSRRVVLRDMHTLIRRTHQDGLAGEKSFEYGQIRTNQRVEAWCSILRKHGVASLESMV